MLVKSSHRGVGEEHAAATVGLQPMFVRINDNGVHVPQGGEGLTRPRRKRVRQAEVSAVSRIGVNSKSMLISQPKKIRQGSTAPVAVAPIVATTTPISPVCRRRSRAFKSSRPAVIAINRIELEPKNPANPAVRIMGLC